MFSKDFDEDGIEREFLPDSKGLLGSRAFLGSPGMKGKEGEKNVIC